jgi:hypothetical protein
VFLLIQTQTRATQFTGFSPSQLNLQKTIFRFDLVEIITEMSPFISENNLGQPPYKSEFFQVRFDTEPRLLSVFDLALLNLQNAHFKFNLAQRKI